MRSLLFAGGVAAASAACKGAPSQLFVNYGASPDQMWVSWATTDNAAQGDNTVKYGTSPNGLGATATGQSVTYKFKKESSYVAPYTHHVLLEKLTEGTTYYYQVGGSSCGYSGTYSFQSHMGVSTPTLFALIGDLGQTSNSNDTLQHVAANPDIQAIIHVGDLSYADSEEERWDSWQELIQYVSSRLPWMTQVGNHETETDTDGVNFKAYNARFWMPAVNNNGPSNGTWYSHNAGLVHWVHVAGYETFASGSAQFAWLQNDLASVDKKATPWTIVTFHQPYFNSNNAHQGEANALQAAIEDLLYTSQVDVVFSGHVHAYERSYRGYKLKRDPKGPFYITIGDGGNREGLASSWINPQPAWSAFRQASYGHGELQTFNATHMFWSWHQNPDLEPKIADSLWIVKGQDTPGDASVTGTPKFRPGVVPFYASGAHH